MKKTNTHIALKVLRVRKCDLTVALNNSLCRPQIQNIVRKEKSKKGCPKQASQQTKNHLVNDSTKSLGMS